MAEGWANHLGLTASSCGTHGSTSVASHSVAVMAEKGIDISNHQPRLTGDFDAAEWDLVISMGCGVKCPELTIDDDWAIPDPYGGSIEEYRTTRKVLEMKVRELVEQAELGE